MQMRGLPRVLRGLPRIAMQPSPWTRCHTCHMSPSDLEVSNMDATPGRGETGRWSGSGVRGSSGSGSSAVSQRDQSSRIAAPVRLVDDVHYTGEVLATG